MKSAKTYLFALVTILLLLAVVVLFYFLFIHTKESALNDSSQSRISKSGSVLSEEEYRAGKAKIVSGEQLAKEANYEEAADYFEKIVAGEFDDQLTPDQVATARRSTIYRYRVTGNPLDSLSAVRDLKANILDKDVSPKLRAISINTLATAPCWFARDETVLQEIYAGAPFSQYYREDINQSVHDMLQWSLKVYPTPKAAASLAYWYGDQVLKNDYVKVILTKEQRNDYIQKTSSYVTLADELAKREELASVDYTNSQRYVGYLYRRAVGVGTLAVVGKGSVEEYQKAYQKFYEAQEKQDSHNGSGYVPFAYVWQAKFNQLLDIKEPSIQSLLSLAVKAVENDPVPQANELVDFIGDKANDRDGRFSWYAIQTLRDVSPEFNDFVEEVELANR